jgi:murein DD-endopeptidase MepM/ murein hydrolase activator NlpD
MKFVITSAFGALEQIRSGVNHTGIDLAMPKGTKLRSITEGVVERVTNYGDKNIGTGVIIRAKDGSRHIFGHMDSVSVHTGDHVHSGTLIGTSGNSGNVFSSSGGDGAHLHFGMMKDGKYVDPSTVIEDVDRLSGHVSVFSGHGVLTDLIINKTREKAKETATDTLLGVLDAIKDITLDVEYSVCLIGTGILIVLRAVGFKHPWIRPGVLMTIHVLLRFLLGGYTA